AYLCPPHSHLSSLPSSHNPTPRSLPSTLSLHDALPICAGRRRAGSSCSTWRRRAQRGSRRTQLPRAGAARAGSCWTSWWVDPPAAYRSCSGSGVPCQFSSECSARSFCSSCSADSARASAMILSCVRVAITIWYRDRIALMSTSVAIRNLLNLGFQLDDPCLVLLEHDLLGGGEAVIA